MELTSKANVLSLKLWPSNAINSATAQVGNVVDNFEVAVRERERRESVGWLSLHHFLSASYHGAFPAIECGHCKQVIVFPFLQHQQHHLQTNGQ